jgi:hypothetical protein
MSQAPAHQYEWWDHIFILHALKVGLAGVLALFFAEALRLEFPPVVPHGPQSAAFHNRLTSIGFGRLPTHSDR